MFSLVLTTCQTFEITSRVGVDYALNCELTVVGTQHSDEEKANIAETALRINQIVSLVLAIALWLWIVPFGGILPGSLYINRSTAGTYLVLIAVLESLSGLPWDLLLLSGKADVVALRQGFFAPLKLLLAAGGASIAGIGGGLLFYGLGSVIQLTWIRQKCRGLLPWPNKLWPKWGIALGMIRSGISLYGTNILSGLVFLPLVTEVARSAGVAEVGYLRVGQIMVQLFTLLPGALAPVLFLRLRTSEPVRKQESLETSLGLIWWIGLGSLAGYLILDKLVIRIFFGDDYLPSLQPTRLLVLMAVLDSVNQVLHTSLLANRRTGLFAVSQNTGAVVAAGLGWCLIPSLGLKGFLVSKLSFSVVPVVIYLTEAWPRFTQPKMVSVLALATVTVAPLCWWTEASSEVVTALVSIVMLILIVESRPLMKQIRKA